ncbi:MAG: hypothetical protein V4805_15375 [Pseudomonadota bacterium]
MQRKRPALGCGKPLPAPALDNLQLAQASAGFDAAGEATQTLP